MAIERLYGLKSLNVTDCCSDSGIKLDLQSLSKKIFIYTSNLACYQREHLLHFAVLAHNCPTAKIFLYFFFSPGCG
jgi:hypothetical protein